MDPGTFQKCLDADMDMNLPKTMSRYSLDTVKLKVSRFLLDTDIFAKLWYIYSFLKNIIFSR